MDPICVVAVLRAVSVQDIHKDWGYYSEFLVHEDQEALEAQEEEETTVYSPNNPEDGEEQEEQP